MLISELKNKGSGKMLPRNKFIRGSIDIHLFFNRIMKEHAFFLQAGFAPKDTSYIAHANKLRMELDKLLLDVVNISNGVVSPGVIKSGEVVTKHTLRAEEVSSFYTGIIIPTNITKKEMELVGGDYVIDDPKLEQEVYLINKRAIDLVTELIEFKIDILNNVLSCKMFTLNYPLLIDHILREAKLYLSMIERLQSREDINVEKEIYAQQLFWNRIMAEHALFIRGLLDPTENELIDINNDFAHEFEGLIAEVIEAINKTLPIEEVTKDSLDATKRISDFNTQATEGLIDCKIESIIIPLLGDHALRESNHYLRILEKFSELE